jgi:Protein of unknown function (DUF1566)
MKRFLGLLLGFVASAGAAIRIEVAVVQIGFAFITGNGAEPGAQITWEGIFVTRANNNNGEFSFSGAVPSDCIGELSDRAETVAVQVLNCTPAGGGASAPVPQTGQTTSFGARDDGALKKGVVWPTPRFTDNSNGTITDNLTGLIWLKNAHCLGSQTWANALAAANALAHGNVACGLSDGSVAGDWRLPNRNELTSLLDLGASNPALPAGHPFTNFVASNYWSSTASASGMSLAWLVSFGDGVMFDTLKTNSNFVTAVRGGL